MKKIKRIVLVIVVAIVLSTPALLIVTNSNHQEDQSSMMGEVLKSVAVTSFVTIMYGDENFDGMPDIPERDLPIINALLGIDELEGSSCQIPQGDEHNPCQ